jgi:RNA polymerase sigma-B factor
MDKACGGGSFGLDVRSDGADTVVSACGAVDFTTAPMLRAVLVETIGGGRRVTLDLSRVGLLDAFSVGVLVSVNRLARQHGVDFGLTGPTGIVRMVLEISGVEHLARDGAAPAVEGAEDRTIDVVLRARSVAAGDERVREGLRQVAILHGYDLATSLARAYRRRGEPADDLAQVALVGLIKAVDQYDPGRGTNFGAYAVPTIMGEVKRHFRDKGWQVRVPRRLQELGLEVRRANEALYQELRRPPTEAEIAEQLGVPAAEVAEAMVAAQGYRPMSLSVPAGAAGAATDGPVLADQLGADDQRYELVDNVESLKGLLAGLPDRERHILRLRFFDELTQAQIAERVGLSQMHVSRLLTDSLTRLRHGLLDDAPAMS